MASENNISGKEFASELKSAIVEIKSNGTAAIYCDNLINYLDDYLNTEQPPISPVEIERHKANLSLWVEQNKALYQSNLELFKSVIESGQNAIKAAFLLNGGAAVAMLAFIGNLARYNTEKISVFSESLLYFVLGTLLVSIIYGITYLSQWFYASDKNKKIGFRLNIASIILGVTSYLYFAYCAYKAYLAFSTL